jgi:succinoglycan biosynthesis protein ExoW
VNTVSVIIPFFQRKPGILTQALRSVLRQRIPDGWGVEVIIIDDGSPVSAQEEVCGLQFGEQFRLRIIWKENGGVAAARNRGLLEVATSSALIAFLDSDDCWPENHLARAIQAMAEGFDLCFRDNARMGHHESHCRSPFLANTAAFLDSSSEKAGFVDIPIDCMIGLTLGEFPCQASTVVYRRSINNALHFDTDLRCSGEDVLFFTTLVSSASRVCIDLNGVVECGGGVNIYFSNLSWDSDKFLAITVDHFVMRRRIGERVNLSACNQHWNDRLLDKYRRELAFHMVRNLVKHPLRAMRELKRLARMAPGALVVLPIDMIRVGTGRLLPVNTRARRGTPWLPCPVGWP